MVENAAINAALTMHCSYILIAYISVGVFSFFSLAKYL